MDTPGATVVGDDPRGQNTDSQRKAKPGGEASDPLLGTHLGPYRVVARIGSGGMGVVYLGLRADDAFDKQVAIKVLKPGMDSAELLRRFRAERQILASLDHSNIAQLLDGGSTPGGLPYLVMEYVGGRPYHRYCDERRLGVAERLRLFVEVVGAVQFAHQNLIVHRDLKPSNILVTAEGVPKLLDFGIAKLLGPELAGLTVMPTDPAATPMTPEYASPEQLRGEPVGAATDVYALGLLLYETLTGGHPHRTTTTRGVGVGAPREVKRAILEDEPLPPSAAVRLPREERAQDGVTRMLLPEGVAALRGDEPERLCRRLRGDLDNIVLRALAKEPARRYASAFELAQDLRRHLEGKPVSARPATLRYRVGKFIGRHRLGVGLAATLALGLVVTSVVVSLLAVRLARERDRAEQAAARAERVTRFLTDLLETSDPELATHAAKGTLELIDVGVRRLTEQLGDQPAVRAELERAIGRIYRHAGKLDRAEPLLRSALQLSRQVYGGEHERTAEALVELARLLRLQEDLAAARSMLDEAARIQKGRLRPDDPAAARTEYEIGLVCWRAGDLAQAERRLTGAVATRRRLEPAEARELAGMLTGVGIVLVARGRAEEAAVPLRQALELRMRFHGQEHPAVADSLGNLALVAWERGEVREAERYTREALALRRRLSFGDHAKLADNLTNLGALWQLLGRTAEAAALHEEAIAMRRRLSPAETEALAVAHENLGAALEARGDLAGALRCYRESAAIRLRLFGEPSLEVAWSQALVARALAAGGEWKAASRRLEAALRVHLERGAAVRRADWARVKGWLAGALVKAGEAPRAESVAREALAEAGAWGRSWRLAELEAALAASLAAQGRANEAEPLLRGALETLAEQLGPEAPLTRAAREDLTRFEEARGAPSGGEHR